MSTRTNDSKTFHQLVKSRETKVKPLSLTYTYTRTQGILDGFKQQFEKLALDKEDVNFDTAYHKLNPYEVSIITEIVKDTNIPKVTMNELE